ncbi:MAG: hypothetical protein GXP32_00175 [Kiritimatiellaeota bacterium]|nr:hypothetical protein [Kiritimatiellota bacterium]
MRTRKQKFSFFVPLNDYAARSMSSPTDARPVGSLFPRRDVVPCRVFRVLISTFSFFFSFTAVSAEPLYEYAKTHWKPSPYLVSVVHKRRFSKKESAALNLLKEAKRKEIVELEIVDANSHVSRIRVLGRKKLKSPYIVLRFPDGIPSNPVITLPLSVKSVNTILTSPTRIELAKRLANGVSTVFLFIDGDDSRETRSAEKFLRRELTRLEELLNNKERSPELKRNVLKSSKSASLIRFSVLRIPRSRRERCIISIIHHSDPDLEKVESPIVVPVFGRARALPAFYGKGINRFNIAAAADSLTEKRSDFLKSGTSGFDILVSADWNALFSPVVVNHTATGFSLTSIAVAMKAHADSRYVEREKTNKQLGSNDGGFARMYAEEVVRHHTLAHILVLTAAALLLIFSAVIARRLQDKLD